MKIMFNAAKLVGNVQKSNEVRNTNPNFRMKQIETPVDSISFTGGIHSIKIDKKIAKEVAHSLTSSTSGHRAPFGSKTFDKAVVEVLTAGVGQYAIKEAAKLGKTPAVIIGGDTRVATRESLPQIKEILANQGIDVYYIKNPVPTPLLAQMTQKMNIPISILMTASHNPWADGGYNLVTDDGAIAPAHVTKKVGENIENTANYGFYKIADKKGNVHEVYPYEMYKEALNDYNLVNWDKIKESGMTIYYDGLQGTGNYVLPQLLGDYGISYSVVKSGEKEGPNPTKENLTELSEAIVNDKSQLKIGLANDGDADRFGVVDERGQFVSAGDVIMLLGHHLSKNKGKTGDIIRSQATTSQLDLYAKNNGLNVVQTPVGFKYIAEDIIEARKEGRDILVAGEESGGLTVNGHIPEKDGIIALLLMADLVATEGKPLSQILADVKSSLGTNFREQNFSKKLSNEADKAVIMNRMENIYKEALEGKTAFGDFVIDVNKTEANAIAMENYRQGGDGVKLYFTDGSSILVRKSGTEPKVKAYIETYNDDAKIADNNVVQLRQELDKIFSI